MMTYLTAASAATHTLHATPHHDLPAVQIGLEVVLHGWHTYTAGPDADPRWDVLGTAAQAAAATVHHLDPVLIVADTDPNRPVAAWHATTALVRAVTDHLDRIAADHTVTRRQHYRAAAATLRRALRQVS